MHHPGWFESAIRHPAGFLANVLEALTPLSGRSQHAVSLSGAEDEPCGVVVLLAWLEQGVGELGLGRGSITSGTASTHRATRKGHKGTATSPQPSWGSPLQLPWAFPAAVLHHQLLASWLSA